ncbi:hypothetical protein AO275_00310 [Pseudomonas viridiflava]|nr:hypothetical protein AO275_00310 [Pseudomonas viridiflava]
MQGRRAEGACRSFCIKTVPAVVTGDAVYENVDEHSEEGRLIDAVSRSSAFNLDSSIKDVLTL